MTLRLIVKWVVRLEQLITECISDHSVISPAKIMTHRTALHISISLVLVLMLHVVAPAPAEDEIKMMPGLTKQPSWKQYSGYLTATGTRHLHYWFLESAGNPATDPVVLWMNGGPGCSSDLGLLTEHGPFRIMKDGKTVEYNQYSWNSIANMIYLEAPAGVGFSYSDDKNYTTDDNQVSLDNYVALQDFFKKFPEYKKNDFYITGESYGGIYVPTLSARVVDDPDINFRGFAVGNGLSDWDMNENSLIYFEYYHGLIGDVLWNDLKKYCCDGNITRCSFSKNAQDPSCNIAISKAQAIVYGSGLNVYNLYGNCEGQSGATFDPITKKMTFTPIELQFHRLSAVKEKLEWLNMFTDKTNLRMTPACIDDSQVITYLNNEEVRNQLHIPSHVQKWDICSAVVGMGYKRVYNTMKSQYLKVLDAKKRVLVYNGDIDMACNFLGDEWFVDDLGLQTVGERKAWHYTIKDGSKQVAGYVKQLENLSLVTVRGAGHMVPTDRPDPALIMFTNFIQGKPYNS